MITKKTKISEIKKLLDDGYVVEIDSPDGWVGVNYYVDKGDWEEYLLELDDGKTVSVNKNHLFETRTGWKFAKELIGNPKEILTDNGYVIGLVRKTEKKIPIVDINVNHVNHRYYANGISSHNTGVGKSLFMCHCAAHNIMSGLNVLYITLEMAEERISERIDANLLDIKLDDLVQMPKESFLKKINRLRKKTDGKLIVKEYPTACAGSANFRHLLNELALKKKFRPDIIYIDYLNICASSRIKASANANSYTYIKAIAEELRGLAIEFNVPIFSATQTTRGGYDNSDLSLTDTSESFGLPATADFMFGLVTNENLEKLNQILVIQLKNRYGDLNYFKKFVIGVDRSKMKLYDTEQSAQEGLTDAGVKRDEEDDTPTFDQTDAGHRMNDDPDYRKAKMKALI
jgi:hypothetical protein